MAIWIVCALLLSTAAVAVTPREGDAGPELKLWYDEPASQTTRRLGDGGFSPTDDDKVWQQSTLPIGNGDLGASIWGEIATEKLVINEKTLWSGGPSESRPNYIGGNLEAKGGNGAKIQAIQDAFAAENVTEARRLCNDLIGGTDNAAYGYYLPMANLTIAYTGVSDATNYRRSLSLDNALAEVSFTAGGVNYTREYLSSHPDNVIAGKLTASAASSLTFSLPGKNSGGTVTAVGSDALKLSGALTDNQLQYAAYLKVAVKDGTVAASGETLTVTGATEVYFYLSAATDYKNDYPVYRTGETAQQVETRVKADVDAAAQKGYAAVKADHLEDYKALYDRVSLDLGQTATSKTTDELLSAYNGGTASAAEKRLLEVMLFQYGRYLTIAASRQDSQLPTNLQGLWANSLTSPWHSDYHMNVNLQMNYWPTYSTNLAECADPLIRYVNSLREPGRVTAKIYAGIESTDADPENGFMAHTQNTPYGWTTPGSSFSWGWSPAAVPWILQNCWEYYEYTQDTDYLREHIYPMMKEEAKLYDQMLVNIGTAANPVLASVPAYSPEHGPATQGNTYEQSLVWQLYADTMEAARVLDVDADLVETWADHQAALKGPIEIGEDGQVKEWYEETTLYHDAEGNQLGEGTGHRHLSHMLGLFPGDLIQQDPDWIAAARYSMEHRVDSSTGWGMGQRINTWARLRDGNHAYALIGDLFRTGIYNNLWDAHPPFQIDGNYGYTAGVSEMLVQSNLGFIDLLPALPDAWADGSVSGLVARGNFALDLDWADGSLTTAAITSQAGGVCTVFYPGIVDAKITDAAGKLVNVTVVGKDKVSFDTTKDATYQISEIPVKATSTMENAKALRTGDSQVELSWTAHSGETYQVYRQIDGGDILPLGEPLTADNYTDEAAYDALGTIVYYFSVNNAALSQAISVSDLRNMAGMIDDKDARITYGSGWGDYDGHNEGTWADTVKFIEASTAVNDGQTITFTFLGTGIQVIGGHNISHGKMSVELDGEAQTPADFYGSPRRYQQVVWSVDDLSFGVHTIKLTRITDKNASSSGNKIEFDAFKVLDSTVAAPTSLTVTGQGGLTTLSTVGSALQMVVNVQPQGAADSVTWTSSAPSVATVDENGVVTAVANGTATITATSTVNSMVTSSVNITVALSGPEITTTVEDSTGGTKNSAITWSGAWSPWTGEASKHHGGAITETTTAGDYLQYTFTGTGIDVYCHQHFNCSGYTVLLDDEAQDDISINGNGSSSDNAQTKVASYSNLSSGSHTLKLTVKALNGKTKANLDYFVVHSSGAAVEKSELEELVLSCAGYSASAYTSASWSTFETAYNSAVTVLNNASATDGDVSTAKSALEAALDALVGTTVAAPANLRAALVEGSAVTLQWSAVPGATGYQVSYTPGASAALETSGTICRVPGLASGESYTFSVKAVNASSVSSPAQIDVETLDTQAPGAPAELAYTWSGSSVQLTWQAAQDNVAVTSYQIYLDGMLKDTVSDTNAILSGISNDIQHSLRVFALDAAGNKSLPAALVITPASTPDDPDNPDNPDNPDHPDTPDTPDNPPKPPDIPSDPSPVRPSSGGQTGSGNVQTNADGSTTTMKVGANGSVTKTTVEPSGRTTVVTTEWSGKVTEIVTMPTGRVVEKVNDPSVGVSITVTEQGGVNTVELVLPAALPDLAQGERFTDVSKSHWAEQAVHHIAALGLVKGTDGSRKVYSPSAPMTRGELTQVLFRLSGSKAGVGQNTFGDVASDAWYADSVAWAAKCGLVRGVDALTFSPQRQITREELCVLLYRYASFLEMGGEVDQGVLTTFPDSAQVSGWAEKGLAWCVEQDLVHGKGVMGNAVLDPGASITRAEVAVLLDNFIEFLK